MYVIRKNMYKYQNHLLPSIFLELFQTNSQIHKYNTSFASDLRPPQCRTNIKQFYSQSYFKVLKYGLLSQPPSLFQIAFILSPKNLNPFC